MNEASSGAASAWEALRIEGPGGLLERFPLADPELLRARALLRRVDVKFVVPLAAVPGLLAELGDHYAVVPAAEGRADHYETLYFDTEEHRFLSDHLRGRRPRFKVRVRHYRRRRCSFLEVKRKDAAGRTAKWRLQVPFGSEGLQGEGLRFLSAHVEVSAARLRPALRSRFWRVMLVGLRTVERVTLDVDLGFDAEAAPRGLGPLAIVEVKQARHRWRTPVVLALRRRRVRPLSISKYCAGAVLLGRGPKLHRYAPRLRAARRIAQRAERCSI